MRLEAEFCMSPLAAACSAFSFCCSSLCLELISPWRCGWYLPSMPSQPLRSGGGSLRAEKPWLLASTLPTLVAAVAVMEDICQGGIPGFALHGDRSVGASLRSLHGWVGRPLEDRPGTKEKERLPRPSLMSDAMRLGRRVAGLVSPRGSVTHPDVCSTNQSVFRSVPRSSCSIHLIC